MERGLLWLPLLVIFVWLVWSGKKEYEKVQLYQSWVEQFDNGKYDIYAVLGKKGNLLTWGKPTSKGIINQSTFSLTQVEKIEVTVNHEVVTLEGKNPKGNVNLKFSLTDNQVINIPFTDIDLAFQWLTYLTKFL